jgi:hypothetical protein
VTVSCAQQIPLTASADLPRPPQFFMTTSGDSYRPGEGPDRQVTIDYIGMICHGRMITHVDSLAHFLDRHDALAALRLIDTQPDMARRQSGEWTVD